MYDYKEWSLLDNILILKRFIAKGTIITTPYAPIASFVTTKSQKAKGVSVLLEPIQDLHGYDKPWSGGAGKQLLNPSDYISNPVAHNGITATNNGDGTFTLNGTATDNAYISLTGYTLLSDYGFFQADTSYTLSGRYSGDAYIGFGVYGSGSDYWALTDSGVTMTFTASDLSSKSYRLIVFVRNGTTLSNAVIKPMICKSSESNPTTYEPYSNICPISGRTECVTEVCGKNLLNKANGSASDSNWWIGASGKASGADGSFVLPSGTYTFSSSVTVNGLYVIDENNANISVAYNNAKVSFTLSETKAIKLMLYKTTFGTSDWTDVNIQLELGSTATDYEPYDGNTYTVSWQTEAGTVYGGTIDLTTGVLTVDTVGVSVAKNGFGAEISGTVFNYRNTNGLYPPTKSLINWARAREQQKCNMGNIANPNSESAYGSYVAVCYTLEADPTRGLIRISEQLYQAMSDSDRIQVIYKILTPQTYQLTPTEVALLKGQNNVWSDGDVSVTYRA